MKNQSPRRRGELIELLFLQKATSLGFLVSKPFCEESYDFVVDSGGRLWRVQVKSTRSLHKGGYLIAARHFLSSKTKQAYTVAEIDILAAHIVPLGVWYIIPVEAFTPRKWMWLFPQHIVSKGRYEVYREAWSLMQ